MATDGDPAGPCGPEDATAALTARLRRDMVGALELFTVYLGERLGLYRALAADGPATSTELAGRTGTAERYVRTGQPVRAGHVRRHRRLRPGHLRPY